MQLTGGTTVRIVPDSPYFPAYVGDVDASGTRITFPGGFPVQYQGPHEGYESPRVEPESSGGDPCYTYHHFEEDGTGELWECVPCRLIYRFTWEAV